MSPDKRTLATADVGEAALLVIWNAVTGKPLWTAPQERTNGIVAMDFSAEGRYLATLSNTGELLLGWTIPVRFTWTSFFSNAGGLFLEMQVGCSSIKCRWAVNFQISVGCLF